MCANTRKKQHEHGKLKKEGDRSTPSPCLRTLVLTAFWKQLFDVAHHPQNIARFDMRKFHQLLKNGMNIQNVQQHMCREVLLNLRILEVQPNKVVTRLQVEVEEGEVFKHLSVHCRVVGVVGQPDNYRVVVEFGFQKTEIVLVLWQDGTHEHVLGRRLQLFISIKCELKM